MLELIDGRLGEKHSGELHLETARQKARRIVSAALLHLGWTEDDLCLRLKNDPRNLAIPPPIPAASATPGIERSSRCPNSTTSAAFPFPVTHLKAP